MWESAVDEIQVVVVTHQDVVEYSLCLYEQEAEGDAETVDEDVAGGLAQTLVELAAFMDAAELEPREDVED